MKESPLRLIKRCAERIPMEKSDQLPRGLRGIYVLYKESNQNRFDVVYVGMARAGQRGGIRGRLHRHGEKKKGLWTHFSVFEVWDNIRSNEIEELEGLFRHIYQKDSRANELNKQRAYHKIRLIKDQDIKDWKNK